MIFHVFSIVCKSFLVFDVVSQDAYTMSVIFFTKVLFDFFVFIFNIRFKSSEFCNGIVSDFVSLPFNCPVFRRAKNALDCCSGIFVHSLYLPRINDNHRAVISD